MLYFGLYVQLRRGSVAGYTTDESWAYGPKEGVEAFESITFFIRFIYAINFEHLFIRIRKVRIRFFVLFSWHEKSNGRNVWRNRFLRCSIFIEETGV